MKKAVLTITTALAVLVILVIGAGVEQTAGSMIAAGISFAWLGLVAVANTRRRHRDH